MWIKVSVDAEELSTDTLVEVLEVIAKRKSDGHLTIYKFTTGWKAVLETIDILISTPGGDRLDALQTHRTLRGALIDLFRRIEKGNT